MSASKGEANPTLLIRHMPREFSENDKLEFLQHFGAVSIKCVCLGGRGKDVVYATFPSSSAARAALLRLHQMEVLGNHLIVEFSRSSSSICTDALTSVEKLDVHQDEDKRQRLQDQFMRRLVSWSSKLNLGQPPPSHLHYQYPPPTPATLSNISKALSMHPRLYTQLLHLMNRMNLPPPFQDEFRQKSLNEQGTQTDIVWVEKSSSESEMESEGDQVTTPTESLSSKRALLRRKVTSIKRPRFIKPTVPVEICPSSSSLRPEEVFEKTETEVHPKKIELRLGGSLQSGKEDSGQGHSLPGAADPGGFGVMHPATKPIEILKEDDNKNVAENIDDDGSVITAEQLASNRIPQKDLQVLPVFKNYSPGVPSCRLYVKNISKHAIARDLHFIYRRYSKLSPDEADGTDINMFDVRLMTEGRMKGQAFITLPTVTLAQQALSETNGYILKDKPLVVHFARSAPAPAETTSQH